MEPVTPSMPGSFQTRLESLEEISRQSVIKLEGLENLIANCLPQGTQSIETGIEETESRFREVWDVLKGQEGASDTRFNDLAARLENLDVLIADMGEKMFDNLPASAPHLDVRMSALDTVV